MPATPPERKCYLPTPAQIRQACEEIQRGWTPLDRLRRSRGMDGAARVEARITGLDAVMVREIEGWSIPSPY